MNSALFFSKLRFTNLMLLVAVLFSTACQPVEEDTIVQSPAIQVSGMPQQTVDSPYSLNLNANQSGSGFQYKWEFDNKVVSTTPVMLDLLVEPGTYQYKLTVTNSNNKSVSEYFTVVVEGEGEGEGQPLTDDDNDGVPNQSDACPTIFANTANGCPENSVVDNRTGEEIYIEDCQGCHGDSKGLNADFGGALTKFQCDTCTDEYTLTNTIETTMPKGSAADCDNTCSNKVAKYVLAEFDGYGDNLTGQQLYEGLCQNCHGDGEQTTGFEQVQLIPATCSVCADEQATITKITNTMPFGKSASCDVTCATKINEYMRLEFSGYEGVVDIPYKNLNANGELSFAFANNQLTISWSQRSDVPDFWLLERLNETTQQWDVQLYESGNTTSFVDTQNSIGMYRLYALTNSVASVPVYGQASATQITVDNGAVWGETDGVFFLNKNVSGNFVAEFTLHSRSDASQWSKIGLMARETLTDDSAHLFGYFNGNDGMEVSTRLSAAAETNWLAGGGASLPVRIRFERSGTAFTISAKEAGQDWVEVTQQTRSVPNSLFVGVALSSNYGDSPLDVEISGFTINQQLVTDYTETKFGGTAVVDVDAPVQVDSSQVSINPKVDEKKLSKINRFVFENQLSDVSNQTDLNFNLSQDDTSIGYEVGLNTSALSIEKYVNAAELYAQSIAPDLIASLTCELDDSACINEFITKIAIEYLRATPSQAQITNLNNVYWVINDQLGQEAAIHGLIETLVLSPDFLYQFESDGANMPEGTLVPVTGLAMAYRLSNTLWAGMPDQTLISAALRGELSTPDQIKAQATRMIEDEKAKRGFQLFYRQWLTLEKLETTQKAVDGIDFDMLSPVMLEAMDHYMNSIVFDDQTPSTLEGLLTAPLVATNNELASITNIASNSSDMSMQETAAENGDQRTGLLGQPAMLSLLGHASTTSIVHRGVFVSQQFMCANFPAPPEDVPTLDSIDTTGKSSRAVLDELTDVDGCKECHKFINPVGATFENFDTLGRSRLTDDLDVLVDSSAQIYSRTTGVIDGTYNGLAELNEYLASLNSVKNCFVSQYLTYAIGRVPSANERSSINWLVDQLDNNNGNIKQMLIEATQTPVFLYKKTNSVGGE
ncbi:DUF1588 domain-containing protein [Marinicellulosiphila megalodicopiae]|uniref:DUF1588 domain-containing protein n=1 Tax=Marinicellulosiphila megalodicopiae TaxID=2724896 RepID=UPI003BAF66DD